MEIPSTYVPSNFQPCSLVDTCIAVKVESFASIVQAKLAELDSHHALLGVEELEDSLMD
jgi:hypothetical protein